MKSTILKMTVLFVMVKMGKYMKTSDNHNDDILKGITLFILVVLLFTFIVIIAGIVLL